ncbi:MAG: hypothetical protein E7640_01445 [Ruminococcaceae bacterium]|nr:hypothetical protein [Oscillospiraceae bacterium]
MKKKQLASSSAGILDQDTKGSASIDGGVTATSFADALATVPAGGRVTLLEDIKLTKAQTINKNITIDGADHTILNAAFVIEENVTFKSINITSDTCIFSIKGGVLNLGERDRKESKVTLTLADTADYAISFDADNGTLNSYYADMTVVNNLINTNGQSNPTINIYAGKYEITAKTDGGRILNGCADGGKFNFYGGVFHAPNVSLPFFSDNEATQFRFYAGTLIARTSNPVFRTFSTIPNHECYGFTCVDSVTHSDVDLVYYKPMIESNATLSLDPAAPGISFTATMPRHAIASLNEVKDKDTEISYGMLIAKTSKIRDFPVLNFDAIKYLELEEGKDYLNIPVTSTGTNKYGDTTFSASITGINEKCFGTDYSAAPYVKYTKNGNIIYLFGNFSAQNTRNMKDLAIHALAEHGQNDLGYSAKQIEALEKYADIKYVENDTSVTRVMTLNVLTTEAEDGYRYYGDQDASDYTYEKRLKYIQMALDYAKPDVILFQEYSGKDYWGRAVTLNGEGGRYTSPQLPGYEWVNYGNRRGVPYELNTIEYMHRNWDSLAKGNAFDAHNFVLYSTEKFELVSSGTRFVSKSGTYDHTDIDLLYNKPDGRLVTNDDLGDFTWVVLRDKKTGLVSIYSSTHTYQGGKSRHAYLLDNLQCVTAHLQSLSEANGNAPALIAGDFNMPVYESVFKPHYTHMTKVAKFKDSYEKGSDYGTSRDFGNSTDPRWGTSRFGARIDYIFVNGADTYGYEALNGQICNGEYYPYAALGSGYDVSDHVPVMTNVIIRRGQEYEKENKADYYVNPKTKNDRIIENAVGGTQSATHVVFDSEDMRSLVTAPDPVHGAQYVDAKIVEDEKKGNVLRIAATDETNYVNMAFNYADKYTTDLSGYSKISITFKNETEYGTDLFFSAATDTDKDSLRNGTKVAIPVGNNGVWQTVDIDVSAVSGNLTNIGVYGRGLHTGLLTGDAIYIKSIQLIP